MKAKRATAKRAAGPAASSSKQPKLEVVDAKYLGGLRTFPVKCEDCTEPMRIEVGFDNRQRQEAGLAPIFTRQDAGERLDGYLCMKCADERVLRDLVRHAVFGWTAPKSARPEWVRTNVALAFFGSESATPVAGKIHVA